MSENERGRGHLNHQKKRRKKKERKKKSWVESAELIPDPIEMASSLREFSFRAPRGEEQFDERRRSSLERSWRRREERESGRRRKRKVGADPCSARSLLPSLACPLQSDAREGACVGGMQGRAVPMNL